MRAVVCHQSELTVESLPDPVPGRGQVLVRTLRAGICGSDLHMRLHSEEMAELMAQVGYETGIRPDQRVVMGHEFVAEVVAYGPGCRRPWKPGTRVVSVPMTRDSHGVHMIGYDEASPGAYGDLFLVHEDFTFEVPDSVSTDDAAFTEPLAVAWHAVRRGQVGKGQTAVVIGCGPIGLAVILMLKAQGVRHVVASDFSPARRDLARECGADLVVDPRESSPWDHIKVPAAMRSVPDLADWGFSAMAKVRRVPLLPWERLIRVGEMAGAAPAGPVVFECVGVPGVLSDIIDEVPMRSRVVVVGVCMEPDSYRPAMAIQKETELRFVFAYDPGEFADTLRMLAAKKVDPRPLHTATVGLDGVAAAFDALRDPERHAKILVDPTLSGAEL